MANEEVRKRCFVVSPIGDDDSPERTHSDWLLQGIIKPVFDQHFPTYDVQRADRIARPGMIDSQVINLLLDAEVVIADMSSLNANVFYEMGIRHMAQKPIIHMFRATDAIPFDVKPHRAIPFSIARPRDLDIAQAALKEALFEIEDPTFQVENPVTRARGVVQLLEHATPADQVIIDELRSITTRLTALERSGGVSHERPSTEAAYGLTVIFTPEEVDGAKLDEIALEGGLVRSIRKDEDERQYRFFASIDPSTIREMARRMTELGGIRTAVVTVPI